MASEGTLAELAALEDPKARKLNEQHGDDHGVNLGKLRALAKRLKTQQELARQLWQTTGRRTAHHRSCPSGSPSLCADNTSSEILRNPASPAPSCRSRINLDSHDDTPSASQTRYEAVATFPTRPHGTRLEV